MTSIGMILDGPFPPDPRVENEATTLVQHGYRVVLFCLDYDHKLPETETYAGVEIHRLRLSRRWRSLSALAYTVPWYHSFLRPHVERFLMTNAIDVVHIHDMQSAAAVFAANDDQRPVVLDLHENRPEILREYDHVKSLLGRLTIRPSVWKTREGEFIARATRTVVVTEEAKQAYVERLPVGADRIAVVPNTVRRAFFTDVSVDESILAKYQDRFTLLYLGDTGLRRGLLTVLEGVSLLTGSIPNLTVAIVGKSKTDDVLRRFVAEHKLEPFVEFEGWQDFSRFPSFIQASDVGLCPIHRNPHHDTTYANKIFQCLSLGVPMIVSDCPAQAHLIREEECGRVFRDRDAGDFAAGVLALYEDPDLRQRLGENGRTAVDTRLHWERTSAELLTVYEDLAGTAS